MDEEEVVESISLQVNSIVGTGDPFDSIMLIPLISQWRVPRECVWSLKEPCDGRITRLYTLREPVDGFHCVGVCEKHHEFFYGIGRHHTESAEVKGHDD